MWVNLQVKMDHNALDSSFLVNSMDWVDPLDLDAPYPWISYSESLGSDAMDSLSLDQDSDSSFLTNSRDWYHVHVHESLNSPVQYESGNLVYDAQTTH